MKKQFVMPQLTVVEVKAEQGFCASSPVSFNQQIEDLSEENNSGENSIWGWMNN